MSVGVGGMGWVTPLGNGVSTVWERLLNGEEATAETISSGLHHRTFPVFRVSADATAQAPAHPRLRRSSAISRFAVVAGLAALDDAQLKLGSEAAARTALIFAISNGGVIYTKRFYHEVVESGAQAASPLLFPETVFNAPASHLAAILGITGASYTLVGDGAVGILALKMAEDLLENPSFDRCLIVGAEEADWLLCDAYRRWHLLRTAPPVEPFRFPARGMILSEGAGAILLDRVGSPQIEQIDAGCNFNRQREAAACVSKILQHLGARQEDVIVASANGTFIDHAESDALLRHCPDAAVYTFKPALGESVGAGSIWQVICAVQALRTQQLPPVAPIWDANKLCLPSTRQNLQTRRAIVSVCGLNQQVAGLSLSLPL
jgi:3-oxoacyl-(acyl-carrier-protein) synthase